MWRESGRYGVGRSRQHGMMLAGSEVARTAGIARLGYIDEGRVVGEGDGDVGDGLESGSSHCWIVGRLVCGI